jgi:hypothetical protein
LSSQGWAKSPAVGAHHLARVFVVSLALPILAHYFSAPVEKFVGRVELARVGKIACRGASAYSMIEGDFAHPVKRQGRTAWALFGRLRGAGNAAPVARRVDAPLSMPKSAEECPPYRRYERRLSITR